MIYVTSSKEDLWRVLCVDSGDWENDDALCMVNDGVCQRDSDLGWRKRIPHCSFFWKAVFCFDDDMASVCVVVILNIFELVIFCDVSKVIFFVPCRKLFHGARFYGAELILGV